MASLLPFDTAFTGTYNLSLTTSQKHLNGHISLRPGVSFDIRNKMRNAMSAIVPSSENCLRIESWASSLDVYC